jgi:hypothetical protein
MKKRNPRSTERVVTAERLKAAARTALPIIEEIERTALSARWPDPVLKLSPTDRKARVREGAETVLLDEIDDEGRRRTRGFVRAVLRVPVGQKDGAVYGVFVEVEREQYAELQTAFREKRAGRVKGKLATRLPLLEDAYGSAVEIEEDGSEQRARVVAAKHTLLVEGPTVGPARARDR